MREKILAGLDCFKAYDIRGRVPEQLNATFARALGRAAAQELGAASAVIGHDARLSGPALHEALGLGLAEGGAAVKSLGMCGTEEIYFASGHGAADLGIMITGSHNPAGENGFKLVRAGAIPISSQSGLRAIRQRMAACEPPGTDFAANAGPAEKPLPEYRQAYVEWLLAFSGAKRLCGKRPLRVLADVGNGCAGLVLRQLMPRLDIEVIGLNLEPDGRFPNGVPNPLLPGRREAAARATVEKRADFGIAWDGDFDRCFFYDHNGRFIEGYYMVGLLAREMLRLRPGGRIIHDSRVYWNTRRIARQNGGQPIMGRTGHAFMKEKMRQEDAIYGGEMSAHHYFRDFSFCDTGMLPWLLVANLLRDTGATLAELVDEGIRDFPCSGEINRRTDCPPQMIQQAVGRRFGRAATHIDHLDGLNMEFADWRFNLRQSNTEPLIRLNVESRGNRDLLEEKTDALLAELDSLGARAQD